GILVILVMLLLTARMFYLQVANHEHFTTLSKDNRVKLQPLPPTRGLIYDQNGLILAQNLPAYSLEITPEKTPDLDATIQALRKIIDISDDDIQRFQHLRSQRRRFDSIPLRVRLQDDEVARLAVNRHRFPGVDVKATLLRDYPQGMQTAHLLGYVGRINERELDYIDTSNYSGTSYIGKNGVEKSYESLLHGQVGLQQVEVNAKGRVLRVLENRAPRPGDNLRLFLDMDLQRTALHALGDYNGAVAAIEIKTGGVLALVSKPGYDPNLFVEGISSAAYDALKNSLDKPLFNRAGHGDVDMEKAIIESCDVYFYGLARTLGIDRLHEFLSGFGFGRPTRIDLTGELGGLLPSREWKQMKRHEPWYPGETLIIGIGQGYFLSTPIQLAEATAILASQGEHIRPRVVASIEKPDGSVQDSPKIVDHLSQVDPIHWTQIIDGMTQVIESPKGTARAIRSDHYRIAGKTGTAQVFSVAQDEEYDEETVALRKRDHALFIAFAPVEDPQIAIAVVVENGGHGGSVAAPIAREIMDRYLLGDRP
ncbi:MAG: penicillin-binding protein 2, partial [Candidatus Thiodiazotropha sp.]